MIVHPNYVIPVKVQIDTGRYVYGHVKTLTANSRGNCRMRYGNGKISERSADSIIPEPRGFEVRAEQPIARTVN